MLISAAGLSACGPREEAAPQDETTELESPNAKSLRLYVLDCGHMEADDIAAFDRGGAYDGQSNHFVDPCYLVRHPKGDLLWDAGLPDSLHESAEGVASEGMTMRVPKTLEGQLERIGVPPADVEYFSISHSHFDHVGNANLFKDATFIVHEDERDYMFRPEARADEEAFSSYAELEEAETVTFSDSFDVFGDASAIIVGMPGHTPGHSALLLTLNHAGPILLSGDLYHLAEAREKRTVPVFNTDAEETLRSMDKFEQLARESGARVIIQHEPDDFENLPRAPAYTD